MDPHVSNMDPHGSTWILMDPDVFRIHVVDTPGYNIDTIWIQTNPDINSTPTGFSGSDEGMKVYRQPNIVPFGFP